MNPHALLTLSSLTLEEVAVKFDGPQMGELIHTQQVGYGKTEAKHIDNASADDVKETPSK